MKEPCTYFTAFFVFVFPQCFDTVGCVKKILHLAVPKGSLEDLQENQHGMESAVEKLTG